MTTAASTCKRVATATEAAPDVRARLGKTGYGKEGEGLRTPPITAGEMSELIEYHKGECKEVAEDLGVNPRTVGMWAPSLKVDTKALKPPTRPKKK